MKALSLGLSRTEHLDALFEEVWVDKFHVPMDQELKQEIMDLTRAIVNMQTGIFENKVKQIYEAKITERYANKRTLHRPIR